MPGDPNKVLNTLAMAFVSGLVTQAGRKTFDKLGDALRRESASPPAQLQTIPSWSFIGNAYWGEDGYYYFHSNSDWFVLHPDQTTWIPITDPTCQLFDPQDIYLGSNGITYLQSSQGLFAFSSQYGWIRVN